MILTAIKKNPPASRADEGDELVCWSRMQSEAGQTLTQIVERKERERLAGKGLFFWGVGNAPSSSISTLARMLTPVSVVFSIMKGKPKQIDTSPIRTLVWRRYVDLFGMEHDLPEHVLITSRGETKSASKKRHYALMCHREMPLEIQHGHIFDASAYRNVSSAGGPVGSSQVTALLRRVSKPSGSSGYEINLTARLTGSYWVRLSSPTLLTDDKARLLADRVQLEDWSSLVAKLRSGSDDDTSDSIQQRFL
ncbi:hypothetical protein [Bradyrhizobium centrosematis]|uniref:hypothetical protein n=1 Tax=Bradyrhizobium centrosematis TaxID=1300039 RepID=UPI00216920B2|nr:hypothetical protein [Bradyrhizobium centrosematis]MCS3761589.1 hypothetical protein [Bradyrhizobium centrosematis]MCS3774257.1 hypothetical protein [Bradyrhizobium centrosematis]